VLRPLKLRREKRKGRLDALQPPVVITTTAQTDRLPPSLSLQNWMTTFLGRSAAAHQPRRYRLVDHTANLTLKLDEHCSRSEGAWAFATKLVAAAKPRRIRLLQVGLGLEVEHRERQLAAPFGPPRA